MHFAGLMLVLEFIFSEIKKIKKKEEDGWTRRTKMKKVGEEEE